MSAALRTPLLFALAAAVAGCWTQPTHGSIGTERDDVACGNGRDDDGDGLIDCADPGCLSHAVECGQLMPLVPVPFAIENTYDLCHDRIDDDENGAFDCGDKNCTANPNTCCALELNDVTCSDHLDNDQNGFVDCKDSACSHGRFVTVCKRETACADGYDNDGDDLIDCADSDCANQAGPGGMTCPCRGGGVAETTLATCSDGVDNDCNGYTDCGDRSCSLSPDPTIVAQCSMNAENTLERCMNHVDDDGNGFVDCGDFSCSRSTDAAILAYCASAMGMPPSESVDPMTGLVDAARCANGIDDDGNGFLDCADFGCSKSTDPTVAAVCFEDANGMALGNCSDGLDNDHDGATDCDDYDCAENPAIAVCMGNDFCAGGVRQPSTHADGGV